MRSVPDLKMPQTQNSTTSLSVVCIRHFIFLNFCRVFKLGAFSALVNHLQFTTDRPHSMLSMLHISALPMFHISALPMFHISVLSGVSHFGIIHVSHFCIVCCFTFPYCLVFHISLLSCVSHFCITHVSHLCITVLFYVMCVCHIFH